MKRCIVCMLVLLSSLPGSSCGYSPYGEELRFSIFNPHIFGLNGYADFFYSSHAFGWYEWGSDKLNEGVKQNLDLWRKRVPGDFPDSVIYDAVYDDSVHPANAFVRALHAKHDQPAIDYLEFARECTGLSSLQLDPWERRQSVLSSRRGDAIAQATGLAGSCGDDDIAKRYAFQAIRMAHYNSDPREVRWIYARFFGRGDKTILDHWALYFRAMAETQSAKKNFMLAQVFMGAPDKRMACYYAWDPSVGVLPVLAQATTKEEKAAVWLLDGIRRPGKALECMQKIHALVPGCEGLDILLLREVNKLEDWIGTPLYTEFGPSVESEGTARAYDSRAKLLRRVESDRAYARELLHFMAQKKTTRPLLWKTARAHLLFLARDPAGALAVIGTIDARGDSAVDEQVKLIRALCSIAVQDTGNAILPAEVKPLMLRQYRLKNQRFLFAAAKELERLGNTTGAALILSNINHAGITWEETVYWNATERYRSWYWYYYDNYFDYIDAEYTTGQVRALVSAVESNVQADSFSVWMYGVARHELSRLYDLLGTKYMRDDRPGKALEAFVKVNDTLWTSAHFPFARYLDANPFYTNFYNEHTHTPADTIRFDKESLTRQLIRYRTIAGDPATKHRDYYYFIVANCYLNMTYYGNSWMMKRYYWTAASAGADIAGTDDYYSCDIAKSYYLKAHAATTSPKFAALCLRMAGRCESYRLAYVKRKQHDYDWQNMHIRQAKHNVYYRQLKKEHPGDYDELLSNCYSFERYFEAWKK